MRSCAAVVGALLSLVLWANAGNAEQITIVTWNVKDLMSVDDVEDRQSDLQDFATTLNPDVVFLQELTSLEVTEAIRNEMGLDGFHVACSDFVQSDSANRSAFEVAILSRKPLAQVFEYDPSPDNMDADDPEEIALVPLKKIGIKKVGTSRGFLWAQIPDYKLTVFVVHLKSSRGEVGPDDASNAEKRELVIAAVADGVNEDLGLFPDHGHVVAGDFNVGHSDTAKNGRSVKKDCFENCGTKDRYDETHALLGGGLVGGLKMKNLAAAIPDSTFPSFPGSPIDNVYVAGGRSDKFQDAQKAGGAVRLGPPSTRRAL